MIVIFCGCGWIGCQPASPTATARSEASVAAAADLKYAMDELIEEFHRLQPAVHVRVTYGSSGNFYAQLRNQAPFDLFFSADMMYPRQLIEHQQADAASAALYAVGQIVVWVPNDSPIQVEKLRMNAVLDPAARKVAIANPRHAPYGRAAEAALKHYGLHDQVQNRLVFGENIAQTAQFVESGAADIGIIALSLAMAPTMKTKGRYWLIPLEAYPRMEQGCVIMSNAKNRPGAQQFREYVLGTSGRHILRRYGFLLPGE